ncbi:MAG TPA: ShlB/FhaC/HecB family hemolysin secretion/activation protein [Gammaproteobacteria bacterium]|nr:ShlB/FhaC/HecB family hemolysin secretion/activation protein [Gammaproteobacteria bacterium]
MQPSIKRTPKWRAALIVAFITGPAFAQTPRDAGRILQETSRPDIERAPQGAPTINVQEPTRPALTAPAEIRFKVSHFRLSGNTAFPISELLPLLAEFEGRELSLNDLQQAAARITEYYHKHGYLVARAYIPAQDIKDETVEIAVLEGRVGSLSMHSQGGQRVPDERLLKVVRAAVPEGAVINGKPVERSLLLIDDLAGISAAHAVLKPGEATGTSDIAVDAMQGPFISGDVDFDNYGNRFTGEKRLSGTMNLNSPLHRGDLASVRVLHASDTDYGHASYQIPIGASGLLAGIGYSILRYHLCCEFKPLEARGVAQDVSAFARYPIVRTLNFNLYDGLSLDRKHFFNTTLPGTTSDYHITVGVATLLGDWHDAFGGGGINGFSVAAAAGDLDLSDSPNRAADAAGPRAEGVYGRFNFQFSRVQAIRGPLSAFFSLTGQFATKNLDSSEQFTLGGPNGVRAYPQGEAPGDEGLLANIELRWDLPHDAQLAAFLDHGEIELRKNESATLAGTNGPSNRYSLTGVGVGLNWQLPDNFVVRSSLATRLGTNPGRDAKGNDNDGQRDDVRFWLQAAKYF